MKAAILGGSFNPIHKGHLALVEKVLDSLDYDTVIIIPASLPPHKDHLDLVAGAQRLEMVKLAVGDRHNIIVSDYEIIKEGPSYTIDTVKHLTRVYSFETTPGLIIGDDWIRGFSSWRNVDELITLVIPIVARRKSALRDFPYPCIYLDNDIVPVSSTQIREKIINGKDISSFVPSKVADYIEKHGLYRDY